MINYHLLYKEGLTDADYHTLTKIAQREETLLSEDMFPELEEKGLIKFNKSPKNLVKAVRLSKEGKEFLRKIELPTTTEYIELCDALCDLYDAYGKPTGNKGSVLENLTWFIDKTKFTPEQVQHGIEEWLSNDYNTWLVNLLWDIKRANVYTTINSRTLGQSPLYEFMRRLQGTTW